MKRARVCDQCGKIRPRTQSWVFHIGWLTVTPTLGRVRDFCNLTCLKRIHSKSNQNQPRRNQI